MPDFDKLAREIAGKHDHHGEGQIDALAGDIRALAIAMYNEALEDALKQMETPPNPNETVSSWRAYVSHWVRAKKVAPLSAPSE